MPEPRWRPAEPWEKLEQARMNLIAELLWLQIENARQSVATHRVWGFDALEPTVVWMER